MFPSATRYVFAALKLDYFAPQNSKIKRSESVLAQASECRLLRERKSLICIGAQRPRTHVLEVRKEYMLPFGKAEQF